MTRSTLPCLLAATLAAVPALAQTPIADWHVNETSWNGTANEVADTSGNAYHGTARNGATAVDYAAHFTNAAGCSASTSPQCQYVDFGNRDIGIGGSNVVTVMAWLRWTGSPQQGSPWANVVSNQSATQMDVGQFWLQHSGNSTSTRNEFFEWAVQTQNGGGGGRVYVFSRTRPQANTWYHVAGVYDGTNGNRVIRIYVNGVLENTATLRNNIVANSSAFRMQMGQWAYNQGGSVGNRAFNGDIDEGRIFRAALTQAQIQAQMRIFGLRRPHALDDSLTVEANSSDTVVDVLTNDSSEPPPGTTVAVLSVGAASSGTATLVGGVVRYRPNANFFGADSFSYTMIDSLGATASATVNVSVVDTTAPDTSIVSGPPPMDLSATAAFDFDATEPATFQCSLDGGAFASCADPATFASLADGGHSLLVRAVDGSGNVDATPASWSWSIDATAPVLLGSSFSMDNHPFSEASFITYVTAGMTLHMSASASEPLAAATFRFVAGATTIDFPGSVAGLAATLDELLGSTPPPGSYAASVVLTDLVGNTSVSPVSLPAPGFNAAAKVPSPCVMLTEAGAEMGTDFDGDGQPGTSAVLPGGWDCDDTNPTIRYNAPEIPGDGVANGCAGSDGLVDESTGVFVSMIGSPAEAGTRASPLSSLPTALALASSSGRSVFLAAGTYDDDGAALLIDVPLIGSFDGSWRRVPLAVTSTVSLTQPAIITARLVAGVELDLTSASQIEVASSYWGTEITDSRVVGGDDLWVTGKLVMIRSAVEGPHVTVDAATLNAMHSEVGSLTLTSGVVGLTRSTLQGPATISGTLTAARSHIAGPVTSLGGVFRVGNSTFRAGGADAVITASGGSVTFVNVIFEGASAGIAHDGTTYILARSDLFDVSCPVERAGVCLSTLCGVNGNRCGASGFAGPGDPHLTAGSLAIDGGIGFEDAAVYTANVVDLDGECIAGAPDIGADELP